MNIKKNRWVTLYVLILTTTLANCALTGASTDESQTQAMSVLALAAINSAPLQIMGNWTDTADSNAHYTISNTNYIHNSYLGSATPKTDYTMSIEAYDNNGIILKLKAKQLDFAAFPSVTEKTNTIFQRSKFAIVNSQTIYRCDESFNKNSLTELNADTNSYTFTGANNATCNGFNWSKMTKGHI